MCLYYYYFEFTVKQRIFKTIQKLRKLRDDLTNLIP